MTDEPLRTRFVDQIHPLTGLHQSTWIGVVIPPSRDEIRQKTIIQVLRDNGDSAKSRIATLAHITPERVLRNLNILIQQGTVRKFTGPGVDGRPNRILYALKVKK